MGKSIAIALIAILIPPVASAESVEAWSLGSTSVVYTAGSLIEYKSGQLSEDTYVLFENLAIDGDQGVLALEDGTFIAGPSPIYVSETEDGWWDRRVEFPRANMLRGGDYVLKVIDGDLVINIFSVPRPQGGGGPPGSTPFCALKVCPGDIGKPHPTSVPGLPGEDRMEPLSACHDLRHSRVLGPAGYDDNYDPREWTVIFVGSRYMDNIVSYWNGREWVVGDYQQAAFHIAFQIQGRSILLDDKPLYRLSVAVDTIGRGSEWSCNGVASWTFFNSRFPEVGIHRLQENGRQVIEAMNWHNDLVRPTSSFGSGTEYYDAKEALLDMIEMVDSFGGKYTFWISSVANFLAKDRNKYPFDALKNYAGEKDEIYFRRDHWGSSASYVVDIQEFVKWSSADRGQRYVTFYATERAQDGVACGRNCRNIWGEAWHYMEYPVMLRWA